MKSEALVQLLFVPASSCGALCVIVPCLVGVSAVSVCVSVSAVSAAVLHHQVLVELEPAPHQATELSGDAGAVGRIIADSQAGE